MRALKTGRIYPKPPWRFEHADCIPMGHQNQTRRISQMKLSQAILRTLLFPVAVTLAVTSFAFADEAADSKATTETTHDVSKNVLTGNTTETTTTTKKSKMGDMEKKSKHVHKKKMNKDGKKVKDETENTSETHN
jgi:hypothetical protein